MKIFSASQIKNADAYTIEHEPISSLDLMERAASNAFLWISTYIKQHHLEQKQIAIYCGVGNNGGDGLVIARKLLEAGQKIQVYIVHFSDQPSPDFSANLKRLQDLKAPITHLKTAEDIKHIQAPEICIDAIFGIGLNKPADGLALAAIEKINSFKSTVIAIDMPSGLFVEDNLKNQPKGIIKAAHTLSFEVPKLAFFFAENAPFVGQWEIIPIGLSPEFKKREKTRYEVLEYSEMKNFVKKRNKFDHKGTYGHACIIAGSKGKIGAASLAAKACLRSGVGLLTVQVPKCGYIPLQVSVPEAMVLEDEGTDFLECFYQSSAQGYGRFDVLGIGPGIGKEEKTAHLLKQFIQNATSPMVIDADALNILSENKTWITFLPANSILTPHPGEFDRLAGEKFTSGYERHLKQIELSVKYQVIFVLKGGNTSIATPDGLCYFNATGNPGMATGGSGDVLTGILTSLLAQGYSPYDAAFLGVYIHGLAGDFAKEAKGDHLIASDIIEYLPQAFSFLQA